MDAPAAVERPVTERPTAPPAEPVVSWKAVALPTEHGGWGLLGEPFAIGLCLAPSQSGFGIAIAALGAFLARHPLKLALADRRRRARYPRTAVAERFALLYGSIALLGLAAAASAPLLAWVPLAMAVPLALAQLAYDVKLQGRSVMPEVLGGASLGAVAASIMAAGHWPFATALATWAMLALKAVSSVTYVRARLRLDRGQRPALGPSLALHAVALLAAAVLAALGQTPYLALLAFAVLFVRAGWGLSRRHRVVHPRVVGFQELAFGIGFAVLLVVGHALGW
jgi:4-hydroxybenzoate polyprenyltransferase